MTTIEEIKVGFLAFKYNNVCVCFFFDFEGLYLKCLFSVKLPTVSRRQNHQETVLSFLLFPTQCLSKHGQEALRKKFQFEPLNVSFNNK